MSGTGNCYDNAPMESFSHSLKVAETHGQSFATRAEVTHSVFGYMRAGATRHGCIQVWATCRQRSLNARANKQESGLLLSHLMFMLFLIFLRNMIIKDLAPYALDTATSGQSMSWA